MTEKEEAGTLPYKPSRSERLVRGLARTAGRHNRQRAAAGSLEEAREHERAAASYTDAQIAERGRSLLAAGQSYLNGNDVDAAARTLELAQKDLEIGVTTGTQDAYMTLSRLYPALEVVYERTGRMDQFAAIRDKALMLHADIEEHFGVQITIGPGHSRMMQGAPAVSPE